MFAGNFAPDGWQFCNGQLMAITQNTALFSILGTTYGGDGQQTFALPNLQGRIPMHWGGNIANNTGQTGGTTTVTLTSATMPAHNHPLVASGGPPTLGDPTNAFLSEPLRSGAPLYAVSSPNTTLAPASVASVGGAQPIERTQPYLVVSYIISLFGVFPSRN